MRHQGQRLAAPAQHRPARDRSERNVAGPGHPGKGAQVDAVLEPVEIGHRIGLRIGRKDKDIRAGRPEQAIRSGAVDQDIRRPRAVQIPPGRSALEDRPQPAGVKRQPGQPAVPGGQRPQLGQAIVLHKAQLAHPVQGGRGAVHQGFAMDQPPVGDQLEQGYPAVIAARGDQHPVPHRHRIQRRNPVKARLQAVIDLIGGDQPTLSGQFEHVQRPAAEGARDHMRPTVKHRRDKGRGPVDRQPLGDPDRRTGGQHLSRIRADLEAAQTVFRGRGRHQIAAAPDLDAVQRGQPRQVEAGHGLHPLHRLRQTGPGAKHVDAAAMGAGCKQKCIAARRGVMQNHQVAGKGYPIEIGAGGAAGLRQPRQRAGFDLAILAVDAQRDHAAGIACRLEPKGRKRHGRPAECRAQVGTRQLARGRILHHERRALRPLHHIQARHLTQHRQVAHPDRLDRRQCPHFPKPHSRTPTRSPERVGCGSGSGGVAIAAKAGYSERIQYKSAAFGGPVRPVRIICQSPCAGSAARDRRSLSRRAADRCKAAPRSPAISIRSHRRDRRVPRTEWCPTR